MVRGHVHAREQETKGSYQLSRDRSSAFTKGRVIFLQRLSHQRRSRTRTLSSSAFSLETSPAPSAFPTQAFLVKTHLACCTLNSPRKASFGVCTYDSSCLFISFHMPLIPSCNSHSQITFSNLFVQ